MRGTLERGPPSTPNQPIRKADTTPGTKYSPASVMKTSTPELLRQAKEEQAKEEAAAKGKPNSWGQLAAQAKGGKSRRRNRRATKKVRGTRRRKHHK